MQRYAVHAEVRRIHWDAPWVVVGVWIDGLAFWPAYEGARAATVREREAGNAALLELPVAIAASEAGAARVGLVAAAEGGGWADAALAAASPA